MIADAGIKDAAAAAAAGVKDIGGPIASAAYSQGHAAASSAASGMGSGSARSSAGSGHGSGDHLAPIFRNSPSGDSSEPSDSKAPSSDSRSGSGGEGARQPWKEEEEKPRPESCVKYFDELWFCYSPVFQMKSLYQVGEVDTCLGKWTTMIDCFKKRTKFADEVVDKPKPSLWQQRTPEEAYTWWKTQFGHLQSVKEPGSVKPRTNSSWWL